MDIPISCDERTLFGLFLTYLLEKLSPLGTLLPKGKGFSEIFSFCLFLFVY